MFSQVFVQMGQPCCLHAAMTSFSEGPLWVSRSRFWHDWRSALVIVKPETVVAWRRKR